MADTTPKTLEQIRTSFIDFFCAKGHKKVDSASLIPADDPTLLFTNAGMNQFKDYFLNPSNTPYAKAASVQRCLRVGGKHNDLENVGYTARHHTFFEMLGNFSFGSYFKETAIKLAWEYLTGVLKLNPKKLYITIHDSDDEAGAIWRDQIGIPEDRIEKMGDKDNFWSMGDTGPCGPCSEIHFDRGPEYKEERYLEIWNLVFMQFNRDASGKKTPLPQPCIDTGMGLERIAAVVQGVDSNYETDAFQHLIAFSKKSFGVKNKPAFEPSWNVIADHARAAVFMISDGIFPANEGRGYVLRRILRRAMRHGRKIGIKDAFLFRVAEQVVEQMQSAYGELTKRRDSILTMIKDEEVQFLKTLENGMRHYEDNLKKIKKDSKTIFPGDIAFHLYETYGFPVDLTEDMLKEEGMTVDREAFDKAFDEHREKAKGSWRGADQSALLDGFTENLNENNVRSTDFIGYEHTQGQARIVGLFDQSGDAVDKLNPDGEGGFLVLDKTPFYAESGGQVGDKGYMRNDNVRIEIEDTRKHAGFFFHIVKSLNKPVRIGEELECHVDTQLRRLAENNHTATHILHAALREILGDHVRQAGSFLNHERLTFDFIHHDALTEEEIVAIERYVNQRIWENEQVETSVKPYQEAIEGGATAFFEEKYGDTVRVVSIGDYSQELCGGTHVGARRTGSIGAFFLASDRSVAAKTRRVEAFTGAFALAAQQENRDRIRNIGKKLKVGPQLVEQRLEGLLDEVKSLRRQAKEQAANQTASMLRVCVDKAVQINGFKFAHQTFQNQDIPALRDFSDRTLQKLGSGVVAVGSSNGDKVLLLVKVSKDLTKTISAVDLIRKVSSSIGGGGGGRPELAQAGGSKPDGLDSAMTTIEDSLKRT